MSPSDPLLPLTPLSLPDPIGENYIKNKLQEYRQNHNHDHCFNLILDSALMSLVKMISCRIFETNTRPSSESNMD